MSITVKALSKTYEDGTAALKPLDLVVQAGEFLCLLGPSGCGKTTTLRLVAGLEQASSGTIDIGGTDVTDMEPGKRDIAMVFQNYALYPHMTVLENLTLNLKVAKIPAIEIARRAKETAGLLGLEALLDKKPGKLSGGQRQRVALGRAIIRRPKAFLMDEPLSNLDLKLREVMRTELKRLHRMLGNTTLYVTHDQVEAMTMADRIAVMNAGRLQQIGSPDEIYARPTNLFVAEFIGSPSMNLIDMHMTSDIVSLLGGEVALPLVSAGFVLGIRPEDVEIGPPEGALLLGTIDFFEPLGPSKLVFLKIDWPGLVLRGRDRLVCSVDPHLKLKVGSTVGIRVNPERYHFFDAESGSALQALAAPREEQLVGSI